MAISIGSTLPSICLSSEIPDISVTITGTSLAVVIGYGEDNSVTEMTTVFSETLYPSDGVVVLTDLPELMKAWCYESKYLVMTVLLTEQDASGTAVATDQLTSTVYYSRADVTSHGVGVDGAEWLSSHFLTAVDGVKPTVMGRKEIIWYADEMSSTVTPSIVARYADGTSQTKQIDAHASSRSEHYVCIDVSPSVMAVDGKTLVGYTVIAGARMQEYEMQFGRHDGQPAMIFENIFGLDETLYCDGELKTSPSFKFNSAYIEGKLKNYDIEETRTFKANTGPLVSAQLPWVRDFLTSPYIRLLDTCGDTPVTGKEVVITEAKAESSTVDDDLPAFTFSYQYAQKNQHVRESHARGRIFDNTFDYTFN